MARSPALIVASVLLASLGCKGAPRTDPQPAPVASSSAASTTTVNAAALPAPSTAASAAPQGPALWPELPKLAAGKVSVLGKTGLTVKPPYAHELAEVGTGWSIRGIGKNAPGSFYVLRKTYTPGSPFGSFPCAGPDATNVTTKTEADGSVVMKCGNKTYNDAWYAREVPIDDDGYKTLSCGGSASKPATLAAIEATCRSITKAR